jgi:hypothetical protein
VSHPYTRTVIAGVLGPGGLSATVPPGKVWIATDADFVVTSTTEGSAGLRDGGGTLFYYVDSAQIARPGAYFAWRGRRALTAGQVLQAYFGAGTWHVTVTVYELDA